MSKAATVQWVPFDFQARDADQKLLRGQERLFDSLEKALRFVMETLSEGDRASARILTDNEPALVLVEIERMYGELQ